jgi:hypothetical protein
LREVRNGAIDANPIMFHLFENRDNRRGQTAEFPIDGRAALRTKMIMDIPAARRGVRELSCGARDGDGLSGVIGAHTERRTGSALAVEAVTGNDEPGWFFRKRDRDCPAAASGVPHRKSPPQLTKGKYRACLQASHHHMGRNFTTPSPCERHGRERSVGWEKRSKLKVSPAIPTDLCTAYPILIHRLLLAFHSPSVVNRASRRRGIHRGFTPTPDQPCDGTDH